MKLFFFLAILSRVLCVSVPTTAVTWYVDGSVTESGNGLHPWTAFKTIQEGVDAGNDGDTVTVAQGTYVENILFRGRNIVLVGDSAVMDGNQAGRVVTFTGTEEQTCVLSGFKIQGGKAVAGVVGPDVAGGGIRGGTDVLGTKATIANNIIVDNAAYYGGGLAYCDGLIQGNVVCSNIASSRGGGMYACNGTIRNNTVVGNSADSNSGGLDCCTGDIYNCIIYGNISIPYPGTSQLGNCGQPSYCCIQNWTGEGEGNLAGDPRFVDPDNGDYRLLVSSPCVDRGLNEEWMSEAVDLDGNKRIIYGRSSLSVDIGAYEFASFPLAVVEIVRVGVDQPRLTWFSRAGDTYAVWSCINLCAEEWIELATVPSQGGMTSWTDDSPLGRVKFYRVEMR